MTTNTQQLAGLLEQADAALMSAECHQWLSGARKDISTARTALTRAISHLNTLPVASKIVESNCTFGKLPECNAAPVAPVAQAGQVPEAMASAKVLVEIEAKKYSLNAAGMFDSGAPEHAQTLAVAELLAGFDDDEAEDHWEAIKAYSDLRASNALFYAAEMLAAAPAQGGE